MPGVTSNERSRLAAGQPWAEPVLEARDGEGWYEPEFDPEREGAIAVGIDIIEIARIQRTYDDFGERFLNRVFTERERERYRGRINELAARFAAKEATSKALGTGIVGIRWREMEVLPNRRGKPVLILHGQAAERARIARVDRFQRLADPFPDRCDGVRRRGQPRGPGSIRGTADRRIPGRADDPLIGTADAIRSTSEASNTMAQVIHQVSG